MNTKLRLNRILLEFAGKASGVVVDQNSEHQIWGEKSNCTLLRLLLTCSAKLIGELLCGPQIRLPGLGEKKQTQACHPVPNKSHRSLFFFMNA